MASFGYIFPWLYTWLSCYSFVVGACCSLWLGKLYLRNRKCFEKLKGRLGKPSGGKTPDSLRVLSQNMWCTNSWGAVRKGSKGPEVRRRFDALARAAVEGRYDVLLMQELFIYRIAYFFVTIDDVVYLTEQLEAAGYVYHSDLAYNLPVLMGQNSGTAIFSKHPIIDWKGHTFSAYSLKDSLNAKGFVQTSVNVGEQYLHFFSTHLDSSKAGDVKKSQVNQLVQVVSSVVPSGMAVVAGDFNICSHTPYHRDWFTHLMSSMTRLNMMAVFKNLAATHHSGKALDHVFVGGGGLSLSSISSSHAVHLVSDVPDLPVSDHDGLSFTISLEQ